MPHSLVPLNAAAPCLSPGTRFLFARRLAAAQQPIRQTQLRSYTNSSIVAKRSVSGTAVANDTTAPEKLHTTGLRRLGLGTLVRNIFMGVVFTSPRLLKWALPMIDRIARSETAILNPDRNPILKLMLKPTVYDQFCAGADDQEIASTRDGIKAMGFSGVVLCFGKESQLDKDAKFRITGSRQVDEIAYWRNGNLETLEMARDGDWIGIKMTGAGRATMADLMAGKDPSKEFEAAMDAICRRALAKGCKIWIDAEQQGVQAGIDAWTVGLMRRFNRNGRVLVYNTLQAYLKQSRNKLKQQLALAQAEGWELAIKVVRGAYIANDQRDKIYATKAETDASYDGIIRDVLRGSDLGFAPHEFPRMQLLIAGHNPDSVLGAFRLIDLLRGQEALRVQPDFAQLQGMADVLGCELLRRCEQLRIASGGDASRVPRVYKCLTWGSVQECIQYLLRRIVENGAASDRIRDGLSAFVSELRRRVFG